MSHPHTTGPASSRLTGSFAAFGAFRSFGASLLSPRQLAPDQTVATLKEDTAWLEQQLTSGATSS